MSRLSSPPSEPGLYAGKYRLLREIGRGGMGSVHEAVEVQLDRTVAIKRLTFDAGDSLAARQRFRREVTAAARLTHPGIAQVLGFGTTDDGENYIAMELVSGSPLRDEIEACTTARDVLALFDQMLAVLSYAHARGVVHRDLKPDNIIVTRVGVAPICKLLDFGVAADPGPQSRNEVVGTPRYMAPEQVLADPVGPAADLYALGVMLFEALTGAMPIAGQGQDVMRRKLSEDAPRLFETRFGPASEELSRLLSQLLERDPTVRLASAADARTALAACDEAQDGLARPSARPARPSDRPETMRDGSGTGQAPLRALPFVGRRVERATLADTLAEVSAMGEARVVIIEGPTGIGKSHLLRWFAQQVREEGGRTVIGAAYVEAGGPEGDAFRSGIERHLGAWGKSREELRRSIARFLTRHGEADAEEEAALIDWLRPDPALATRGMALEARRTQNLALVARTLERLAQQRPLVITIDDLQFGGRGAIEQLGYLMAIWRQAAVPALVVGCITTPLEDREMRHVYRSIAAYEGRQLLSLALEPLGSEPARRLVAAVLEDRSLSSIDAIASRAAGNPLFCIQLARLARETSLATDDPPPDSIRGTRTERRPRDSLIPASVQQLIEARIDHAIQRADDAEVARAVLTEIAVLLPPVPTALVELALTKSGISLAAAQQVLDDLVESNLVRELLQDGVETLDLEHPLVAETLLARINLRVMRRRSADALALKEAFYSSRSDRVVHQLAEHAHQAQLRDRARELGVAAAQRALGASRYGEAMKFARRLVNAEEDEPSTSRSEIALLASRIAEETGDSRFAERVLSSSLRDEDGDALEMALALARVQARTGKLDEAAETVARAGRIHAALAARGQAPGARADAELLRLQASIARRRGQFGEAVKLLERILSLLPELPDPAARLVHDNLAWSRHRAGDTIGAVTAAKRALELSAPGLERGWALRTYAVIGGDALSIEERRDHLERSLEIGRDLGAFRLVTSALTHLGDLERAAGDFEAATERFRQVVQLGADQVDHDDHCESIANLAMMLVERGAPEEALEQLAARSRRDSSWERTLGLIGAAAHAALGDLAIAAVELRAQQCDPTEIPACWGVARAAEQLATALSGEGLEDVAAWARDVATSAWARVGLRETSAANAALTLDTTDRMSDVTRREVRDG